MAAARPPRPPLEVLDALAGDFHGVEDTRPGNDGRAVLVVVEDRDVQGLDEPCFDLEAFRCLDVFQVDGAEGRGQAFDGLDHLLGVLAFRLMS